MSDAAKAEHRTEFVKSCIDLFIEGDLPTKVWTQKDKKWIDTYGGTGVAKGIFDGVDLDWEWPGCNDGLDGNHFDEKKDPENLPLLPA